MIRKLIWVVNGLLVLGIILYLYGKNTKAQETIPETPKESCPKTLSVKDWVLCRVAEEGFDPVVIDKIVICESRWDPTRRGDSGQSWGMWQIYQPVHHTGSQAFDPYWSTEFAIGLMKSKLGLNHWSCYRFGFYKNA